MRKSWLAVLIGVVAALVVGEVAIRLLVPDLPPVSIWPTAEMQLKSEQIESLEKNPEIVIIGSSISQASIDPDLLSRAMGSAQAYNAALPHSTLSSNLVWLEDVVLAGTTPRFVVIGVLSWATDEEGGKLAEAMHEAAGWNQTWLSDFSAVFRVRGVLADWDGLRARERLLDSGLWTKAGHFTGYYEHGPSDDDEWVSPARGGALDPTSERVLAATVEMVSESGAQAVLLVEPVCCQTGHDAGNERYLERLRDRAESWGVPLWDTHSLEWPAEFFADPFHFNRAGTEAYTTYVARLLLEQTLELGEGG